MKENTVYRLKMSNSDYMWFFDNMGFFLVKQTGHLIEYHLKENWLCMLGFRRDCEVLYLK